MLGLSEDQVRVVAPDVGGGFGAKGARVEDVLIGWLARATGKPVRWTETRSENMVALPPGRAMVLDFELGANREGVIEALKLDILADAGAYPGLGAFLPNLTALMSSGVYRIPKIEASDPSGGDQHHADRGRCAAPAGPRPPRCSSAPWTCWPPSCRWTRPRSGGATSSPTTPSRTPRPRAPTTTSATTAGRSSSPSRAPATRSCAASRPAAARTDPPRASSGIGLSAYVEVTNGISEEEFGAVEITAVRRGDRPHRLALAGPGPRDHLRPDRGRAARAADREGHGDHEGDTDVVPRGTGTYGSKSTQIGGVAAGQASEEVVEKGKRLAAAELEANPEDMVLDVEEGRFHVTGAPQPSLSWGDLASRLDSQGRLAELSAEVDFKASQPTFPFGAHVAVVEVDTETGAVQLKRMVAVDDAGRIINPLVAEGQVHGGVVAGIAQALYEELTYDADGNPQNANLVTYCIPAATELPPIEVVGMETPTPINPLGVKGIGESGTIGATPAVHNAVIDALSPYGVRHLDMPVNGETVWRAVQERARGGRP